MRIRRWLLELGAASALVTACAANAERASYAVPHRGVSVVVERTARHASLVEFKRSAYLTIEGRVVARTDLFVDTGGYSRVNVYRLTETTLLLRDADGSYLVDTASGIITKDAVRRRGGIFVGSFDVDPSKVWRFLPSTERAELPTEFSGG